jgi:hypothetical protein
MFCAQTEETQEQKMDQFCPPTGSNLHSQKLARNVPVEHHCCIDAEKSDQKSHYVADNDYLSRRNFINTLFLIDIFADRHSKQCPQHRNRMRQTWAPVVQKKARSIILGALMWHT